MLSKHTWCLTTLVSWRTHSLRFNQLVFIWEIKEIGVSKMDLASIKDWFLSLGSQYHVNPFIFGAIYVGAIPFFTASIAWLVRNYRQNRSILLPIFSAGFWFVSAYLYLIIAGRNVPFWVYGVVVALIVLGGISTIRKVRRKIGSSSA